MLRFRRALATVPRAQLPYRIRVPLAALQARKAPPQATFRAPALGDGEALESDETGPDYLALALRSRVYDYLSETPLQYLPAMSERLGATVHLKREDLLPCFTFYSRCAINELASLRRQDGVSAQLVTASIGSRGQALAWAAGRLDMRLTVVMPSVTPTSRQDAITRLGATVLVHGESIVEAQAVARRLADEEGFLPVGSHDSQPVLGATGTVGLELLRQYGAASAAAAALTGEGGGDEGGSGSRVGRRTSTKPSALDAVFVSVGGGSLLAGVASSIKAVSPSTKVIAVELEGADLLSRSLLSGHRVIDEQRTAEQRADGIFVSQISPEVFRLCDELVDEIVLVEPSEVAQAVQDTFLDTRAVLELAGAISVAGVNQYAGTSAAHANTGARKHYVAIGSDAANVEFDLLMRLASQSSEPIVSFGPRGDPDSP